MIEGLQVTVKAAEVAMLCHARANHHHDRATKYAEQIASAEAAKLEGMDYTSGDPVRAYKEKMAQHTNDAAELEFYAEHLEPSEVYRLKHDDLRKLGIVKSAY